MNNAAIQRVADAFVATANRNDTAQFLDLFTKTGAVDDWGSIYRGRNAIKKWSDREFIGVQVALDVTRVSQSGNEVVIDAKVGGNGFNGPSRFVLTIDDGKVAEMRITAH